MGVSFYVFVLFVELNIADLKNAFRDKITYLEEIYLREKVGADIIFLSKSSRFYFILHLQEQSMSG